MDRVNDVKDEVLEMLMKKYKTGKYAEGKAQEPEQKPQQTTEPKHYRKPYLDENSDLVIPHDCDPKYRWWQSGQSVSKTLEELKKEDLIN